MKMNDNELFYVNYYYNFCSNFPPLGMTFLSSVLYNMKLN